MEGIKRISPQLYVSTLAASCCDAAVQLIAFDPATDFVVQPWLQSQDELNLQYGEVVAEYNLAADVGETVRFYNTDFKVAAKLEKTGMGYDNSVFMSFDTIYKLKDSEIVAQTLPKDNLESIISMLMVDVKDGVTPGVYKIDIQEAYPEDEEIYACTADDFMSGLAAQVKKLTGYGSLLTLFLVISTSLALISIFVITINERKYEFGIFYTLGARKNQVAKIILTEAAIISFVGGILGIVFSFLGITFFHERISINLDIPYLDIGFIQVLPIVL